MRRTAQMTHQVFCINSPSRPCGMSVSSSCFCNKLATAIAIHTAGGAIHQRLGWAAPAQRAHQSQGTRVAVATFRRWCQMHHPGSQSAQAGQAGGPVQVALQRGDPQRAQLFDPAGTGSQRKQAQAPVHLRSHTHTDITAAHQQHAFAPKARRQGTWPAGIQQRMGASGSRQNHDLCIMSGRRQG